MSQYLSSISIPMAGERHLDKKGLKRIIDLLVLVGVMRFSARPEQKGIETRQLYRQVEGEESITVLDLNKKGLKPAIALVLLHDWHVTEHDLTKKGLKRRERRGAADVGVVSEHDLAKKGLKPDGVIPSEISRGVTEHDLAKKGLKRCLLSLIARVKPCLNA